MRRPIEFLVGDHVYLKVSPMKGMKRFRMKCGNVAYQMEMTLSLAGVHDIFHVSQLKKSLKALEDVVLLDVGSLEADLRYLEYPVKILYQKDRVTRHKYIKFFKVQWSYRTKQEAT
jgi:hypothetical protein